jgi:hypothetical protein
MADKNMHAECLDMLESLFSAGEDVPYPVKEGTPQICICGSEEGYVLSTKHGPKHYESVDAVLDELLEVANLEEEEAPLNSVHQNLSHLT